MTNIKKSTILASAFSLDGAKFFFGDMMLSEDLLRETEEFIERNALSVLQEGGGDKEGFEKAPPCCPRCLKAHLISKLGEESIDGFEAFEEEELGHHGHYLDGDEVVKI
jgi:hypothetical protein